MAWIDRRPSGRYRSTYRDTSRKLRSKTFDRKRDADAWGKEQDRAVDRGTWIDSDRSRITFGEWCEQWKATRQVSDSTRETQDERLRSLVLPTWRTVRLDRITLSGVKSWVANMTTTKGLAAGDVRKHDSAKLFVRILDAAVDDGYLSRNPARSPSGKVNYLPRADKTKPHRYLTARQLKRVADAAQPDMWLPIMLTGFTGLRIGELTALQVRHVDLLRCTVRIEQAYSKRADGSQVLGPTKTHESRTVHVVDFLRSYLQMQVAGRAASAPLFPTPAGQHRVYQHTSEEFNRAVKAASTAVSSFQDALGIAAGLRDGVFSTRLGQRVREFQQSHALTPDGTVGVDTWRALADATRERGRRWTWLLKRLERVALAEGDQDFERLTFHDLRHTAASLAIASGANVKDVQAMLGHKSAAMTLDTYAGLFPGGSENVAKRMNDALAQSLAASVLPASLADVVPIEKASG